MITQQGLAWFGVLIKPRPSGLASYLQLHLQNPLLRITTWFWSQKCSQTKQWREMEELEFERGAAGWLAWTLTLFYATPDHLLFYKAKKGCGFASKWDLTKYSAREKLYYPLFGTFASTHTESAHKLWDPFSNWKLTDEQNSLRTIWNYVTISRHQLIVTLINFERFNELSF